MKILILDYSRDSGGANTISEMIYRQLIKDKCNDWLWLTSDFKIESSNNFYNIRIPWIKKSLFNRIIFENIYLGRIVNTFQPDLILSLQNMGYSRFKGKQILYVHQAIPFMKKHKINYESVNKKFKLKLIEMKLKNDVSKATYVIVQTNFMKNIVGKYNKKTLINLPVLFENDPEEHIYSNNFIYPTNSESYKRFDLIYEISKILIKGSKGSSILITLNGDENKIVKELKEKSISENLPIKFIGKKTHDEMVKLYRENHLVFTSDIESLGLPLVEAMHYGCKILALKTPFADEVLKNYKNKWLFDKTNISEKVISSIESEIISKGKNIGDTDLLQLLKGLKIIE